MRRQCILSLLALFSTTVCVSGSYIRLLHRLQEDHVGRVEKREARNYSGVHARASVNSTHLFLNNQTERFAVNGTGIPEVGFNVGESYAGLLPITDHDERDNLFFWFFPTDNEEHKKKKEIIIWLNGGPGCSSLLGLLQENGPFVWQPGTLKPVPNPWSWHHLTNIVWIDQPVTVGFSTGNTTIHNEDELAKQFMGFWKNFIKTFGMQGYKVYIVGESYGAYYGSYISSHFINANDTTYYDVAGLMIIDGIGFNDDLQSEVVAETFVRQNKNLMPFADPFMANIHNTSSYCGYSDFVKKYYTYPPAGTQPSLLPWQEKLPNGTVTYREGCGKLWDGIYNQSKADNACFNPYNILDFCPRVYSPLSDNAPYFNRSDVKVAIHVSPEAKWELCVNTAFVKMDDSPPPSRYALPHVIDKTKNVMLVQGGTDFLLCPQGVLLGVQNMTWGGRLGFEKRPTSPFYVPRLDAANKGYGSSLPDKSGVVGTCHEERGLTVVVTTLAGHEGPQFAPLAAFRQLEKLLGRVDSLSDTTPFTLPQLRNVAQDQKPLGNGTFPIPWVCSE